MRFALLPALALVLLAGGAGAQTALEAVAFENRGRVLVLRPSGQRIAVVPGRDPSLSPNGRVVAFVRGTDVYTFNVVTRRTARLGRGVEPAWAPDGASVAASVGGHVNVMSERGSGSFWATTGDERSPSWSPDGREIVFSSNGAGTYDLWSAEPSPSGRAPVRLTELPGDETQPAVAPDGRRIAFVRDGRALWILDRSTGALHEVAGLPPVSSPTWSPDGTRIAVAASAVAGTSLVAVDANSGAASPLAGTRPGDLNPWWGRLLTPAPPRPKPAPEPKLDPNELLPDLDQRAPYGLTVAGGPGRWLLGFTSATDNVGTGPIWFRGSRSSTLSPVMRADQLIRLRNGRVRVLRGVGVMRYTWSSSHSHWHLLRFQSYELRRAGDFRLLVRDRKSGFCLADHYGLARHRVRGFSGPHFFGNCAQGRPDALAVEQGTSIGYTDRYPAHFHGQNVDVTGVPAGIYVLVHRATNRVRERTTENNAASVRLRLTWPNGARAAPSVAVLRVCERTERCDAR